MSLKESFRRLGNETQKNADLILTMSALIGLVSTIYFVAKETPEAIDIIDDEKKTEKIIDNDYKEKLLSDEEYVTEKKRVKKECAKNLVINYLPAAVSAGTTAACIIGSNRVSRTRNAAVSSALNAATIAYQEYRDAVKKEIGPKKELEIEDKVRKEHIDATPLPSHEDIFRTGNGNTLCRIELSPGDATSGYYFYSSPDAVYRGINKADAQANAFGYISYQDLLWFWGLRIKGYSADKLGWNRKNASDLIRDNIKETSHVHPVTGEPVLDLYFYEPPYPDFDKFG